MTVLRGVGIESESVLAFAGLHQMLRPPFARVDSQPKPQAAALRAAFALATESVDDRFRVAVGVLSRRRTRRFASLPGGWRRSPSPSCGRRATR